MTVSARSAKALTGSGPQRVFGSFLTAQKGTRPAGRNLLNKKDGSDADRHSHKNLSYGRRGKAKLCTKLFCLLFSRKK